ncbi:uncharacterized protein ATC70_006237 [Mucor velutinosus]|uniref:Uncharacterized protein n=1 Tax=Mucor velutinosus TaxID=708070 RepID=A0AAN7HW48_9FUNG|nr:hypothetical protein ATC70_006237 [Mucor velutinosus]
MQALSLSGVPHESWILGLRASGISSWHDQNATAPIIYLGYPICSSTAQKNSYFDALLTRLRDFCRLYSVRNLTFRGRATVLNSVLFSKAWHIARLFPFSATDIHKLQQLGASFVNHNAKVTWFSFATLCLPRTHGGLGLLDPAVQINALQWRWLHPLLHPIRSHPSYQDFSSLSPCHPQLHPRYSLIPHLPLVSPLSCLSAIKRQKGHRSSLQPSSRRRYHCSQVWCLSCFLQYLSTIAIFDLG